MPRSHTFCQPLSDRPASRPATSPAIFAAPLLALLLAALLPGQAASYTYIDQPLPYSNSSSALLVAQNTPRIGTTFQVQIPWSWSFGFAHGPCWGQDFLLLTGFQNPSLDLGAFGVQSVLFTSAELWTWSAYVSGPGTQTVSLVVPLDPGLVGVSFYQQVVAFGYSSASPCPSYGPSGLGIQDLSRGGHGVIGT